MLFLPAFSVLLRNYASTYSNTYFLWNMVVANEKMGLKRPGIPSSRGSLFSPNETMINETWHFWQATLIYDGIPLQKGGQVERRSTSWVEFWFSTIRILLGSWETPFFASVANSIRDYSTVAFIYEISNRAEKSLSVTAAKAVADLSGFGESVTYHATRLTRTNDDFG